MQYYIFSNPLNNCFFWQSQQTCPKERSDYTVNILYFTWLLWRFSSNRSIYSVAIHEALSSLTGLLCLKLTQQKHISAVLVWAPTEMEQPNKCSRRPQHGQVGVHRGNTNAKKQPEILIRWLLIKKTDKRQG